MAKVGAQRAAELTGKSKSTIQRSMKSGKISYEIDHNGRRVIDVAELERAFGLVPQGNGESADSVETELRKAADMLEMERMKMRIKVLEEQLDLIKEQAEDLKEQRDQWQKQAQQVMITSQYSQKQAEELKAEIKERERRARMRRQQMMERGMQDVKKGTGNENKKQGPISNQKMAGKGFDIQNLWQKIRTPADKPEAETDKKSASA